MKVKTDIMRPEYLSKVATLLGVGPHKKSPLTRSQALALLEPTLIKKFGPKRTKREMKIRLLQMIKRNLMDEGDILKKCKRRKLRLGRGGPERIIELLATMEDSQLIERAPANTRRSRRKRYKISERGLAYLKKNPQPSATQAEKKPLR